MSIVTAGDAEGEGVTVGRLEVVGEAVFSV